MDHGAPECFSESTHEVRLSLTRLQKPRYPTCPPNRCSRCALPALSVVFRKGDDDFEDIQSYHSTCDVVRVEHRLLQIVAAHAASPQDSSEAVSRTRDSVGAGRAVLAEPIGQSLLVGSKGVLRLLNLDGMVNHPAF
jgi:hypothetical protein